MHKKTVIHIVFLWLALFFIQEFKAQDNSYIAFKDSLFYGPRVTGLKEVLTSLNTAIRNTSDPKKAVLYQIKKLHPLIELEQLNNALELTDYLLTVAEKDLEVTVRIRRALIYEFLGDFNKGKAELDIVNTLFEQHNVIKDEEYGAFLYRSASLYRVNRKKTEALTYINKAIVFGEEKEYHDVLAVSYMVKAFIVKVNNKNDFKTLLSKSLKKARLSKNKFHVRSIYGSLASTYRSEGKPKLALVYADSILYYDKLLHKSISGTNSYLIKSECYSDLGNLKLALKNYQIYHERSLEDKISKESIIRSELEHQQYIEKENLKRDQVFKDNEDIKEENRTLLWFISFFILLFVILMFSIILISKRNKMIRKQKEDIERKNNLLSTSVKEKEILLKEVHHRVKNNLTLIISLIDFQTLKITSKKGQENFKTLKQRIEAIAILHEQILINTDKTADNTINDNYNINTYIVSIAKSLIDLHTTPVVFVNEIEDIHVSLEIAAPIGMLINELISNSLKHNDSDEIKIKLKITEETDTLVINYSDSGAYFKQTRKKSLGLFIIESMVLQLKGTMKRTETHYLIKIKKQKRL